MPGDQVCKRAVCWAHIQVALQNSIENIFQENFMHFYHVDSWTSIVTFFDSTSTIDESVRQQ